MLWVCLFLTQIIQFIKKTENNKTFKYYNGSERKTLSILERLYEITDIDRNVLQTVQEEKNLPDDDIVIKEGYNKNTFKS